MRKLGCVLCREKQILTAEGAEDRKEERSLLPAHT